MTGEALVVDASVAVKWYLEEEAADRAVKVMESGLDGDPELIAPALIAAELGNVLWQRNRRGEMLEDEVREVWAMFGAAPLVLHDIIPLMPQALEISLETGCAVYDALYVALAEAKDAKLVTADRRLVNALESTPFSETARLL